MICACRERLYSKVRLSIISPALRVALSIADMRAPCSLAAFSSSARNLSVQIFKALLENNASEHGARMTAMDNATRNAGEMIDKLSLIYNRKRQAGITAELIEIVSAKEAM